MQIGHYDYQDIRVITMQDVKFLKIKSCRKWTRTRVTQAQFPNLEEVVINCKVLSASIFQGLFPMVEKMTLFELATSEKLESPFSQFPNLKRLTLDKTAELKYYPSIFAKIIKIPELELKIRSPHSPDPKQNLIWDILAGKPSWNEIAELLAPGPNQLVPTNPCHQSMQGLQKLIIEDLPKSGFLALVYMTATEKIARLKYLEIELKFNTSEIPDNYFTILKNGHESVIFN